MNCIKPKSLSVGDTIAIISPSWGGPNVFPHIYENGIVALKKLGFRVKEFPTARATDEYLYGNPEKRALDVNNAFSDPEVNAVIASIGGNDSVRILPFLDCEVIKRNPKLLMGYSDTTTLHVFLSTLGISSWYSPAVMSGFSQQAFLPPAFTTHLHEMFFSKAGSYEYHPYDSYSDGYPDWSDKANLGKVKEPVLNEGWTFVQGEGITTGKLFGGCIEVLEFMKGTEFWPNKNFWSDKILFLETSEEKPSVQSVMYMLRNYGSQGILHQIKGILFGRARDYSAAEKIDLNAMILKVVRNEFGRSDLPIIANMDFGHTEPQWILPLGILAELDCNSKRFSLREAWVS